MRLIRILLFSSTLLICLSLSAQDKKDVLIAVQRTGTIEFLDPKTLLPISQLQIDVAPGSAGYNVGLNGVLVSADGSTVYVEGPIPENGNGCCYLYSIDLKTVQVKVAASEWGSSSRGSSLVADRLVYPLSAAGANMPAAQLISNEWHFSPNGHWLLGIDRQQHVINIYGLPKGNNTRHLQLPSIDDGGWIAGTWSADKFYLYAIQADNTERLWVISPIDAQLGEGTTMHLLNAGSNCSEPYLTEIVPTAEKLFLYERFGGPIDRRGKCNGSVTGGASIIDPQSGQVLGQITPELYFYSLISNENGSELYGVTAGDVDHSSQNPVELVRIDAHTGRVLQSRLLESDYWWITAAKIRTVPVSRQHIAFKTQ